MTDETTETQTAPVVAAAVADASQAQADAAVEIAEIDADARVAVETLSQETARAAIEADTERATAISREEIEWLRNKTQETETALSSLSTRTEQLAQAQETAQAEIIRRLEALTPPPPEATTEEIILPEVPPNVGADGQGAAEQRAAQEARRPKHRLI